MGLSQGPFFTLFQVRAFLHVAASGGASMASGEVGLESGKFSTSQGPKAAKAIASERRALHNYHRSDIEESGSTSNDPAGCGKSNSSAGVGRFLAIAVGPILAQFCPHHPMDSGPSLAVFGRFRAKCGRERVRRAIAQCRAKLRLSEFGRIRATYGFRAKCGRPDWPMWVGVVRRLGTLGPTSADWDPLRPISARLGPNLG